MSVRYKEILFVWYNFIDLVDGNFNELKKTHILESVVNFIILVMKESILSNYLGLFSCLVLLFLYRLKLFFGSSAFAMFFY